MNYMAGTYLKEVLHLFLELAQYLQDPACAHTKQPGAHQVHLQSRLAHRVRELITATLLPLATRPANQGSATARVLTGRTQQHHS